MAVDDAHREFRDSLQLMCLGRVEELCGGRNGDSPPSQVIGCWDFETRRGSQFLASAVVDLPNEAEKNGFFGYSYQRNRNHILEAIEDLNDRDKPRTIDAAIQNAVTMAFAVNTLFWLARETGTSLEAHVHATFGKH